MEDDFWVDEVKQFSVSEETGGLAVLNHFEDEGVKVTLLGTKGKTFEEATHTIFEFGYYRFCFPDLIILKGQTELFKVNILTQESKISFIPHIF